MAQIFRNHSEPEQKSVPIIGIGQKGIGPNGELPVRREIDEWWFSSDRNDLNQQSLFILALQAFQVRGQDPEKPDPLSYLSIAGIHGLPLTSWPMANPDPTKEWWYCAHKMNTFATWHTPYMLLFEQRMHEEMCDIVKSQFSADSDLEKEMQHAADTWRLPFWDWARRRPNYRGSLQDTDINLEGLLPKDGPNIPYLLTLDEVEVRTATGAVKVKNPMVAFGVDDEIKTRDFGDYGVKYPKGMRNPRKPELLMDAPWISACRRTSKWPKGLEKVGNSKEWEQVSEQDKEAYAAGTYQDLSQITECLRNAFREKPKEDDKKGKEGGKEEVKKKEEKQKDLELENGLPEAVLRLFTPKKDDQTEASMPFENFCTKRFQTPNKDGSPSSLSLEMIHDNMHYWIGGGGYMGNPGTSAFDPIFWLHHCNVDRLLSIWQTLFAKDYQKWLDTPPPSKKPDGDLHPLWKPDFYDEYSSTKLMPFCSDENWTFYDSKSVSGKFHEWGYTYPELQRWKYPIDEDYHRSIRESLSRLYGGSAFTSLKLQDKSLQKSVEGLVDGKDTARAFMPHSVQENIEKTPLQESSQSEAHEITWSNNDYVVDIVYDSFELGGESFIITIFLGDVPSNNILSLATDTALGEVFNFASPAEGRGAESGCANCAEHQARGVKVAGQVILTGALIKLMDLGELANLDEETVTTYLRKNLHWRIRTRFGATVEPESLPSLNVQVIMSIATHYVEMGKHTTYADHRTLDTAPAPGESDRQTGQRTS